MTATTATPGRSSGRPRDPQLGARLLACATELIAERGLAAFTTDGLAAHAHAGKAAIYRRWPSVDDLLVDVLRTATAQPAPRGEDPRDDLVALVLHQVDGDRGAVLTELLGAVPHRELLHTAWIVAGGPFMRQMSDVADINARLGFAGTKAGDLLALRVDQLIAYWRERRQLGAYVAPLVIGDQVDELLADVQRRARATA